MAAFDKALDECVVAPFREQSPAVLYHYTNWLGAEGIIRSKQFWATSHSCTNDSAELTAADDVVLRVASDLSRASTGSAKRLLDILVAKYSQSRITQVGPVYLSSFCESSELESQWQLYGDGGRGVCLGLRVLAEPPPLATVVGSSLLRVDYSEESWRNKIASGFRGVIQHVTRLEADTARLPRRVSELSLNALYRIAAYAAVTAKQPQWSSEREWRQVTLVRHGTTPEVFERSLRGKVVRYLKVFLRAEERPLCFDEIVIGPNYPTAEGRETISRILTEAGYPSKDAPFPRIGCSSLNLTSPS